jgi:hypothetical protein
VAAPLLFDSVKFSLKDRELTPVILQNTIKWRRAKNQVVVLLDLMVGDEKTGERERGRREEGEARS